MYCPCLHHYPLDVKLGHQDKANMTLCTLIRATNHSTASLYNRSKRLQILTFPFLNFQSNSDQLPLTLPRTQRNVPQSRQSFSYYLKRQNS
ncbi:hypothetical protein GDO78_017181 [Eleutherodactylus coqui]|uniref:Uncharacterized protein n=1 Tax=Eleutherodactylus coqui TaxID=57060 RepID=A0A8J6BF58_ELECQ|nr:hypothetical protein GDO78_017181 [Eleutherodactylus coqui]